MVVARVATCVGIVVGPDVELLGLETPIPTTPHCVFHMGHVSLGNPIGCGVYIRIVVSVRWLYVQVRGVSAELSHTEAIDCRNHANMLGKWGPRVLTFAMRSQLWAPYNFPRLHHMSLVRNIRLIMIGPFPTEASCNQELCQ